MNAAADRDREERTPRDEPDGVLEAAPGLARLAATAAWRTAEWSVGTTLRLFGLSVDDERTTRRSAPEPEGGPPERGASRATLQARGAELLRRSANVDEDEDTHPAYERILDDLAPDEARILRFLATEGAQPSVDVRTARPFGVGSRLIAPGLTMIGAEAGCRNVDRIQAYLNNLYRLGLVWFSREPVEDPLQYQVLEAQPEVAEALSEAKRTKTVRRSIHLTPFGEDFCIMSLPLDTLETEPS